MAKEEDFQRLMLMLTRASALGGAYFGLVPTRGKRTNSTKLGNVGH
jgi:hypothetical protein